MKFIKKNFNQLIISIILCLIAMFALYWSYYKDQMGKINKNEVLYYESCAEYSKTGIYYDKRFENQELAEKLHAKENCPNILKYDTVKNSTFYWYNAIIESQGIIFISTYLIPIVILILISVEISKKFKSKFIKNELLREDFKKFKRKMFKTAYKNVIIPILYFLFIFTLAFLISGHFNVAYEFDNSYVSFSPEMMSNPIFYGMFILNIIIILLWLINLTLIIQSKNKNAILVVIKGFIFVLTLWIGTELVLGPTLYKLGIVSVSYDITLYNAFVFRDIDYPLWLDLIINFSYFVITLIIVMFAYKDKEKLIQMCEK